MQGLIFDIKHYAVHDGPGIRQTVFFKGCPLSCWWCHNPESQLTKTEKHVIDKILDGRTFQKEEEIGYYLNDDELMKIIEEDTIFFDESGGGVTFSGGEPLMQPNFLKAIAKKCKEAKIHTALDTSGYTEQKTLLDILPFIDLFLYDLKLIDDELHKKYTGISNKRILENLELLSQSGKKIRLRFPVIPDITDTPKNIEEIKNYLFELKNVKLIDILSYHDISKGKYERYNKEYKMKNKKLNQDKVQNIKKEFQSLGYKVKIDE